MAPSEATDECQTWQNCVHESSEADGGTKRGERP
jgi:hypothetical protein